MCAFLCQIMADLENGLWAGNNKAMPQEPIVADFVTAMVKGKTNGFALKGGDSTTGKLKTLYDGARPPHYQPMKKQGSIILGIGGDNSDSAHGTFYEARSRLYFTPSRVHVHAVSVSLSHRPSYRPPLPVSLLLSLSPSLYPCTASLFVCMVLIARWSGSDDVRDLCKRHRRGGPGEHRGRWLWQMMDAHATRSHNSVRKWMAK